MQKKPDINKTESTIEISCIKWTMYTGRRKVCVSYQTNTDDIIYVVYRYRNDFYLKDLEMDLEAT